jgi:hypothetical protein
MLGQIRHVPVVPIDHVLGNLRNPHRPKVARKLRPAAGPVLLLDDTSHGGYQMRSLAKLLPPGANVLRAALYATRRVLDNKTIDVAGYLIPCRHHTFSWNCFRDSITPTLATDMDGVLAGDYHGATPEAKHEREYLEWMANTPCLVKPLRPVQAIITARIEKYRPQTEAWLARHKIRFAELWMRPNYGTNVAPWKAQIYRRISNRVSTFVESEYWLAKEVSDRTGFSAIAWKDQVTFRGRQPLPLFGEEQIP